MELCYHNPPEFAKLSNEQREELLYLCPVQKLWGKSGYKGNARGGKWNYHGNGSSKGKKYYDKRIKVQVASAIKKQRKEENVDQEKETEELDELVKIISFTQPAPNYSTTTDGKAATASAAVKLNSIIKRRFKPWNGVTPQQLLSHAVGMVNLEPNRHLVDKIMMSISSIGESDFYLSAT